MIMKRKSKPLYDVHSHIGLDQAFFLNGMWPYACTVQNLLHEMDHNAIDHAVAFPFCLPSAFESEPFSKGEIKIKANRFPFDLENKLLIQEIERLKCRNRVHFLAMFDPERRVKEQVRQLRKIRNGISGLKTQATVLKSKVITLTTVSRELMEFAEEEKLPVLIHTSIDPSDPWSPARDCIEVAAKYPNVRFNLAHSLRFHRPSLEEAAQLPNVWIDCSAHLIHCSLALKNSPAVAKKKERVDADFSKPAEVLKTIFSIVKHKYLWGSDHPFHSWCDSSMEGIYTYEEEAKVLHSLPGQIKLSMANEAPLAWLKGH